MPSLQIGEIVPNPAQVFMPRCLIKKTENISCTYLAISIVQYNHEAVLVNQHFYRQFLEVSRDDLT